MRLRAHAPRHWASLLYVGRPSIYGRGVMVVRVRTRHRPYVTPMRLAA